MKKIFLVLVTLVVFGCSSTQRYIEGTSVQIGAYVPWESNLYGVELVSYINGCSLKASSNTAFRIQREYCATNSYLWGAVQTQERTKTEVEAKKK